MNETEKFRDSIVGSQQEEDSVKHDNTDFLEEQTHFFANTIYEIHQRTQIKLNSDNEEERRNQDEIILRLCLDSGALDYIAEVHEKEGNGNEGVVREPMQGKQGRK